MRLLVLVGCLSAAPWLWSQVGGGGTPAPGIAPTAELPSAQLVFGEPKLDSPLQLPSTVMDGPPTCGPDGRTFIEFMTPPPMYNNRVVYSISPSSKIVSYPVDQISGLSEEYITSFDPGVTGPVVLLRAIATGQATRDQHFYLAIFTYDGELRRISKLQLSLDPIKVAQLGDDQYLILGADLGEGKARFVIIDSTGALLRDRDNEGVTPSDERVLSMLSSIDVVGMKPSALPAAQRVPAALSLFRPVHSQSGLLILEPGKDARIVELLHSGETRIVRLQLPSNQIADSLITDRGSWFLRSFLQDSDTAANLYQVDPDTGSAIKRINTSGVPSTSIACPTDGGFVGIRWVARKPYLIHGEIQ